jgi:hypothetical protein
MDPANLAGEAGAVLAALGCAAAALALAAAKFARDARAGGGARAAAAARAPPRLSRAQLLSLLANSARNAERALAGAFEAVWASDELQPPRGPMMAGASRRRPAPEPLAVAAAFRARLAELDEELLRAVSGTLGAASGGPLSEADVAHALRSHACAELAAAEARVLALDPFEVARVPIVRVVCREGMAAAAARARAERGRRGQ